ncbi:MAG: hypothetical protein K6G81_07545 [Lachnospiraceae bacterium]|nr:hypothetical protein [Lachnospiraceae bacterium]
MKIASSSISMESQHRESTSATYEELNIETRSGAKAMERIASLAESAGDVVKGMREYNREEKLSEEQRRKDNEQRNVLSLLERMREQKQEPLFKINDETDTQIKLLRRLLEALSGKGRLEPIDISEYKSGQVLDLRSSNFKKADMIAGIRGVTNATDGIQAASAVMRGSSISASATQITALNIGTGVTGTTWQRITAKSGMYNESEYTTFQSQGLAVTEDGRSISFGVELSMGRSFTQKFESLEAQEFIMTDPLIINIDNDVASVTDVKFRFDLDSDGKAEEMSFAGPGSGFLALDKDGNGKIDNGNELFGTKSGDGFGDLAEYDTDGNSWIDENDEIYEHLKVWTKDEDGNDRLMSLKEANVGAIYLGNATTEFTLKGEDNRTNAQIRKTGIYLKENGGVGTLQHVDLAV